MQADHGTVQVSPFLAMPRELRDRVYDDLLNQPPRPSPAPMVGLDQRIAENQGEGTNYYERVLPPIPCIALLRCNRQVAQEMQDAIHCKNASSEEGIQYKLDLVNWKYSMQLTWLSLPTPVRYVKSVWIEYRNIIHTGSRFLTYDPMLAHYLLQMLRRLLTNGPRIVVRRSDTLVTKPPPILSLDSITINFIDLAQDLAEDNTAALTGYRLVPRSHVRSIDLKLEEKRLKRCTNGDWPWRANYQEQRDLWYLEHFVGQIAESGVLATRVKTLRLLCGSKSKQWLIGTRCKVKDFKIETFKPNEVGPFEWEPFFHCPRGHNGGTRRVNLSLYNNRN